MMTLVHTSHYPVAVAVVQAVFFDDSELDDVIVGPPNPPAERNVRTTFKSGMDPQVVLDSVPVGQSANQTDVLAWRRVIVYCYTADELACGTLAERLRTSIVNAKRIPGNGVRQVRMVGEPASYPDPATDLPRYQFTADVLLRRQSTAA